MDFPGPVRFRLVRQEWRATPKRMARQVVIVLPWGQTLGLQCRIHIHIIWQGLYSTGLYCRGEILRLNLQEASLMCIASACQSTRQLSTDMRIRSLCAGPIAGLGPSPGAKAGNEDMSCTCGKFACIADPGAGARGSPASSHDRSWPTPMCCSLVCPGSRFTI